MPTAASENVFIKLREELKIIHNEPKLYIKNPDFFQHQYQKQVKMFALVLLILSGTYWSNYCALCDESKKFCTDTH